MTMAARVTSLVVAVSCSAGVSPAVFAAPSAALSPADASLPDSIVALAPADCLAALAELNEAGKLVPEAVFPGTRLKGLTEEGCSGIRMAGGDRLVGIDLGSSGFRGAISEQGADGTFSGPLFFRMMGFLYSESPLTIAGQTLPAGAWAVEAFNATLRLVGNHETATRYDPAQNKEVPLPKTAKIELKLPLPPSVVGSEATEIPHFAIALDGSSAVLRVKGNEWIVSPAK